MFSYYGGKAALVNEYPAPMYGTIIEPFCGGAAYACKYFDRDVWINDKYDTVYKIWLYLQQATVADIKRLPDLKAGERLSNFTQLSEEEKLLLGFTIRKGGASPVDMCTKWAEGYVRVLKDKLLTIVGKIGHWKITNLPYLDMENMAATWFIDPPYQEGGHAYPESNALIDYNHLREWCDGRNGQIIVCENQAQTWFPENAAEMVSVTDGIARKAVDRYTMEVMWHRGTDPLAAAMMHHPQVEGIHPVCLMVPDQTDEEYRNLRERIKRNGLRRPITVDENCLILDGRHRLKACYETNTPARFETSSSDPMEFVTDAIAHRSLTTGQRAMIGNDMRKWYDEKARDRQHGGVVVNSSQAGKSRDKVGKAVGVGGQAIDRARDIANADPELAQKVRDGDLTINAAWNILEQEREPVIVPVRADGIGETRNHLSAIVSGSRSFAYNADDFVCRAERLLAHEFEMTPESASMIAQMFVNLDGRLDRLVEAITRLYERFGNGPKTD